jgi:hypothetical protein
MTEFAVRIANRPGQLAELAQRLAEAGLNIEALTTYVSGDDSVVRLMVDDEDAARRVLVENDVPFEEQKVLATLIPNEPGALAAMTRRLANAGVNIEAMYLLHTSCDELRFALAVDDHDRARDHLLL